MPLNFFQSKIRNQFNKNVNGLLLFILLSPSYRDRVLKNETVDYIWYSE